MVPLMRPFARHTRIRRKAAFTLLEVLVVVAIWEYCLASLLRLGFNRLSDRKSMPSLLNLPAGLLRSVLKTRMAALLIM